MPAAQGINPRGSAASPTRWVDSVDRGARFGLVIITVIGIVSTTLIAPRFFPHPSAGAVVGLWLLALGQAAILVSALWGPRGWWPAAVVTTITGIGLVLAVQGMTRVPELSDTWWPRSLLISAPAFAVIIHRRGWILGAGLIAVNAVVRVLTWQSNPTLPGLTMFEEVAAEFGQYLALMGVALVAVRVTIAAGDSADRALAAGRPGREADVLERTQQAQAKEADRFVHDEVLHTLRMIALDRGVVSGAQARDAAVSLRRILQIQQRAAEHEGFTEEVDVATRGLGPSVRVVGPAELSLPRDVATALTGAVRECVRNAAKHAGVGEVDVTIRRAGFALAITVSDAGRGFDPNAHSGRLGLRESVLARVADVGGTARVVSAEGRGTTVSLRWSPIPQAQYAPEALGGGAGAAFMPSVAALILPLYAFGLWSAALLARHVTYPWLAVLATLVLVASGGMALMRGLRVGLGTSHSVLLGGLAWAGTVMSVLQSPAGSSHPRLLWLAVLATTAPSVISLFRPVWEAVVVGLGIFVILVIMLVVRQSAPSGATPYVTVMLSPLITTAIAVVVRRLVDRCAFEVWAAEERAHDRLTGIVGGEQFSTRLEQRLLGNRSALIRFLDSVIADPSRLETSATRHEADRLERRLRDLIAVRVDDDLGAQLSRLGRRGWRVRSRWGSDPPENVQRELARVLAMLPDRTDAEASAEATLTAAQGPDGWRVSLLARPADGRWATEFAPGASWQVSTDDGLHAVALLAR